MKTIFTVSLPEDYYNYLADRAEVSPNDSDAERLAKIDAFIMSLLADDMSNA